MENFKIFVTKRIVLGILLAGTFLWVLGTVLGMFGSSYDEYAAGPRIEEPRQLPPEGAARNIHETSGNHTAETSGAMQAESRDTAAHTAAPLNGQAEFHAGADTAEPAREDTHAGTPLTPAVRDTGARTSEPAPTHAQEIPGPAHMADKDVAETPAAEHVAQEDDGHGPALSVSDITGVTFVRAVIAPLDHELNERFWGWRPNDVINITDNINNFQLGVLEVTRRTTVILSERLSRTGITAALDNNLENAANWLMIKPDRYIFPSAETKYNDSLDSIRLYLERLENKKAKFYTRSDNLIPLLSSYVELLGSCDENLAKMTEADGSPVSYFKADDYFFYARGVASSLHTILQAIAHDFSSLIETRRGAESLHHAIISCHHAMQIDPWLILESGLSSVFANHRANMAAPISHAGFYLRVLITTLST